MNEHIVIIRPQQPKTGLLDVIQNFLENDGLKTIQRRIVIIENGQAFIMEGNAANPKKRPLGNVPTQIHALSGKCYVYKIEEIGEDEVNIKNTMEQIGNEYGSNYISQSANEAVSLELLFG